MAALTHNEHGDTLDLNISISKQSGKSIVIIGPRLPTMGGISIYISHLERNLIGRGYTVLPVSLYVFHMAEVHTRDFFKINFLRSMLSKISRMLENLWTILSICRNHDVMLVHVHTAAGISFYENALYMLIFNLFNVPSIMHIHSTVLHENYNHSNILGKTVISWIFSRYSKVVVLSESWKKTLINTIGLDPRKVAIVTNAADIPDALGKTACRNILGLSSDMKILFTIGTLIERKGFNYLVLSMAEILKARDDVICFIGGSGQLNKSLQTQINELGLSDHVKLLGFIPTGVLHVWLNACDIFVLPSLREGFPIVQIEAMACGKPVVATRNGGSEDIITSDNIGLLCHPGDPVDLGQKILLALDKEWDEDLIRNTAYAYNWDNTTEQTINIYNSLTHR